MKRGLLVVILFVLAFGPVFAQETGLKIGDTTWKFNGEIRFMYTDQTDPEYYSTSFFAKSKLMDPSSDDFNRMYQRYRFGVTGELNDRLSAVFTVQVGDEQWGNKNYNEREVNIRTLYAYLQFRPDFMGDNTTFRVGLQGYDDIFQYSIWSDEATGIIVNHSNDVFNANLGYLTLRDDDVDTDVEFGPDPDGYWCSAETLYLFDMNYKFNDAFTVKGAFYYDYMKNLPPGQDTDYRSKTAFYGIGADYQLNESLAFGGHFVMRSGKNMIIDDGVEDVVFNQNGSFAYAYSTYTMDKFTAKINFGYTPFNIEGGAEGVDVTSWNGAFALMGATNPSTLLYGFGGGNQWQTAYGLEYFGRGEVCDRQALNGGYGGFWGLMVISANLSYDFVYANFGIMRSTVNDDFVAGDENFNRSYGTELDLGVKTEVMKGLEFKAVYAMFFTGDFYAYGGDEKLDNGHEMSMLLRYAF